MQRAALYAAAYTPRPQPFILPKTKSEAKGEGATLWGKLKSGVGWISLDYTTKV